MRFNFRLTSSCEWACGRNRLTRTAPVRPSRICSSNRTPWIFLCIVTCRLAKMQRPSASLMKRRRSRPFLTFSMPARYAIDRRRWDEAVSLTLPHSEFAWNPFPHAEATLVFARALGAARSGRIDAARKDLDSLQELRANLIKANSEGTWQEHWVSQIQIHHRMVTAWITYTQGGRDEALQILRDAADREDSTEWDPVMPGNVISARELLGELLVEINEPARALQAFEDALKRE